MQVSGEQLMGESPLPATVSARARAAPYSFRHDLDCGSSIEHRIIAREVIGQSKAR